MSSDSQPLRLGSRGSMLARMQSQSVADRLMAIHPGLRIELVIVKTTGDQVQDRPLHDMGGKGLFTKELEQALLSGTVDFAVHSFKDVPVTMPLVAEAVEGLVIAAVPEREEPWDVLVCARAKAVDEVPRGARVGTGSLRRRCQLLDRRGAEFGIEPLRGNIDTRVRKVRDGEIDAAVLAMAGLKRSGLFDPSIMTAIPADVMLPAAAQGALALQCRADDTRCRELLYSMNHTETAQCVEVERAVVRALNGDCTSPISAYARVEVEQVHLRAALGAAGGGLPVRRAEGTAPHPGWTSQAGAALARAVAGRLLA